MPSIRRALVIGAVLAKAEEEKTRLRRVYGLGLRAKDVGFRVSKGSFKGIYNRV